MNEHMKALMDIRLANICKNLEARGFPTCVCENVEELKTTISSMIQEGESVSAGSSQTLIDTGVLDMLRNMDITFSENDRSLPKEEQVKLHQKAFIADTFLCSVNAITEEGEIYNVDGTGNRVAAMIYGPKQVLLVVSTNKIVRTMEEAVHRLEEIAAPANCLRLKKATPCANVGYCMDCKSKDRICATYVTMRWQYNENRIKVVFIKGNFGF